LISSLHGIYSPKIEHILEKKNFKFIQEKVALLSAETWLDSYLVEESGIFKLFSYFISPQIICCQVFC